MKRLSLTRTELWSFAALAAASLLILACAPAQYFGRQQDDLLYFISAHALSEGHYRLFTSPLMVPLVMITPGFPLLLLPLAWLAPGGHALAQAFCALLTAALPWALYFFLKKRLEPLVALLIALLVASSPIVLSQAGTVMSETAYLLSTLALLAALEKRGAKAELGAGGWLLAASQIRPAGISLLPALLAGRGRAPAPLARLLGPAALGAALWSLWSWSVSGQVQELEEFRLSYADRPPIRVLSVAWENLVFYLEAWGGSYLPAGWTGASVWAGLLLAALAADGCRRALRRDRADRASWLLIGAAAMHAVWAWQYQRYLIPLLPFLLAAAAASLGRFTRPALGALLAAQLLVHAPRWIGAHGSWATPELERTYAFINGRSRPEDILASALFVRDGYHAGRPSVPLPDGDDAEDFAAALKRRRVRQVLWQSRLELGLTAQRSSPLQERLDRSERFLENRALFKLIHEDREEGSRVYWLR